MAEPGTRGRPRWADVLTPAEWRVVDAVRHGMSNPLIARRHGVSVDAVKFHVSNALTKLGLTSRRELRTWDGVRRDSILKRKERKMSDILERPVETRLGPIGQIARSVADIKAAERWHRDVLGLTHLYTFGNLAFFDAGGVRLFLEQGDPDPAQSVIYFRVDDIHATHETLKSRGAKFISAPHLVHRHADGMEEWMAFFEDNEGRPLAIMAQVRA